MAAYQGRIIAIGTSAGGLQALDELIAQLPSDIPAAIFVVQHLTAQNTGRALLQRLGKYQSFASKLAEDGETFRRGHLYIAPPDCHLLVKQSTLLVTKGARENRFRPAIDPLFRSAAVNHGSRVIGVVLSGLANDGTAGLSAIHRCGGATVVQDPDDATYPDMPRNALANVNVDYCVALAELGAVLDDLSRRRPRAKKGIPKDIRMEAIIAERVASNVPDQQQLGDQVPYNCPNCGGVLWQMKKLGILRYRCHTGHSFTADGLLESQSEKIEETLWVSLRMFEERNNLLQTMIERETGSQIRRVYKERMSENQVHIERIRRMLLAPEKELERV